MIIIAFAYSFIGALIATPVISKIGVYFGAIDRPEPEGRKRHGRPVPLWGGSAVFVVFAAAVLLLQHYGFLAGGLMSSRVLGGVLLGAAILVIGGMIDDRFDLKPGWQIFFAAAGALVAVASGLTIEWVKNPFGGYIQLDQFVWQINLIGQNIRLVFPGGLLAFLWLLGMTGTTKVLDGLDGLVAGLTMIAALMILGVALRPELNQSDVAVIAAVLAGVFGGFLVWNFHPAAVFLGQGGSTMAGFFIGALAIISGSKVATALLVMGVPIIDLVMVVAGRAAARKRIFSGDLSHLHFKLLGLGASERQAVILLYAASLLAGLIGFLAGTGTKAAAFVILAAALIVVNRVIRGRSQYVRQ